MLADWNPLVASGEFERVYVHELSPGDVTPFGEVVESVTRQSDHCTTVRMRDGSVCHYRKATTTVLVAAGA